MLVADCSTPGARRSTLDVARWLYAGLSIDTGSFRWASAPALRLAARLVEAGVDNAAMSRLLHDTHRFGWLPLLSRVLSTAALLPEAVAGGGLVYAVVGHDRLGNAPIRRGRVHHRHRAHHRRGRSRCGVQGGSPQQWSVSLRAKTIDLAPVATGFGGGGHALAAGYSVSRAGR